MPGGLLSWPTRFSRRPWHSIQLTHQIRSLSGTTYFAIEPPSRYETATDLVEGLAVAGKEIRFGPIPVDEAPNFVLGPRTVGPQQLPNGRWVAGGGTEAATLGTV